MFHWKNKVDPDIKNMVPEKKESEIEIAPHTQVHESSEEPNEESEESKKDCPYTRKEIKQWRRGSTHVPKKPTTYLHDDLIKLGNKLSPEKELTAIEEKELSGKLANSKQLFEGRKSENAWTNKTEGVWSKSGEAGSTIIGTPRTHTSSHWMGMDVNWETIKDVDGALGELRNKFCREL